MVGFQSDSPSSAQEELAVEKDEGWDRRMALLFVLGAPVTRV
jgi:hypothetical protein